MTSIIPPWLCSDFLRILRTFNLRMRIRTVEVFTLMVMLSFLELGFIYVLTYMGMALADAQAVREAFLFRSLFYVSPALGVWCEDARHLVIVAGFGVVLGSIVKNFVSALSTFRAATLGEDISIDIGKEIMERYLYRDYAWHLSTESGLTFQRMLWRTNLAQVLIWQLSLYSSILTLVILFASLAIQEPVLTTFSVAATSGFGVILYSKLRKSVDNNAIIRTKSSVEETTAILCATKGIRDVIIYNQQKVFLDSVVASAFKGKNARIFNSIAPTIPTWVLEAVGFGVVVASVSYLIVLRNANITRVAAAMALLTLTAWRVLPYCNRVVSYQVAIRGLKPMASAVLELLENMRKFGFKSAPKPDPNFRFENQITLRDVCFSYPQASGDSLKKISFTVPKGAKVGLIGPSGAGKSTLAGVLCGLLPPTSGTIFVDNLAMGPAQLSAFSLMVGYVPQVPFLFSGTLGENVAFSTWGRPLDHKKIRKACDMAAIDFLDTHPKGLLQPIGENGAGLSGGQAQRVSIARALYAKPSIIIFDEATSSLDQGNENVIIQTIRNLPNNVTTIIIAHRLTTVEHCDILIWLDHGAVVNIGHPQEILPAYKKSNTQLA